MHHLFHFIFSQSVSSALPNSSQFWNEGRRNNHCTDNASVSKLDLVCLHKYFHNSSKITSQEWMLLPSGLLLPHLTRHHSVLWNFGNILTNDDIRSSNLLPCNSNLNRWIWSQICWEFSLLKDSAKYTDTSIKSTKPSPLRSTSWPPSSPNYRNKSLKIIPNYRKWYSSQNKSKATSTICWKTTNMATPSQDKRNSTSIKKHKSNIDTPPIISSFA